MPNYTTNLNLVKPLVTEQYDIAKVTNDNADILDLEVASKQEELVSGTNIKTINGNSVLGSGDLVIESGDWKSISATLTYASVDSPTFVANTSIDLTTIISVGMKLKLTQTTVKYFIVTAITSTTIALYGGTDYTLANASITLPYFSSMKVPFGFPMNPDKWSVVVTGAYASQVSPTNGVWYNIGGLSIVVPLGLWYLGYEVNGQAYKSSGNEAGMNATLSTANNTESNASFTSFFYSAPSSTTIDILAKTKIINLTTKTTYYLNFRTIYSLTNMNVWEAPTPLIQAVCAYL